ncbi:hypothetical protein T484DRAFT_3571549 [Baffinella frigidus]|nr:hypothetical protein T484DRAFT_3571549 [Cryptophyta sp. CCMP2293]
MAAVLVVTKVSLSLSLSLSLALSLSSLALSLSLSLSHTLSSLSRSLSLSLSSTGYDPSTRRAYSWGWKVHLCQGPISRLLSYPHSGLRRGKIVKIKTFPVTLSVGPPPMSLRVAYRRDVGLTGEGLFEIPSKSAVWIGYRLVPSRRIRPTVGPWDLPRTSLGSIILTPRALEKCIP